MVLNISRKEFFGLLSNRTDLGFTDEVFGHELAIESNIGQGYKLRILTSIHEDSDVVRGEGEDAIRVMIVDSEGEIYESTPHIKRTEGFDERIIDRIDELIGCESCGSSDSMRINNGKNGDFFFCLNCDHTESV
jgi:hypothetical protein